MAERVSIILLTRDRWAAARRCLQAVRRSTPAGAYELLVRDNASTDGTAAGLARLAAGWPELRVRRNARNLPFAAAVNAAMREASGSSFVWLNDDTEPRPGWLRGLLDAARPDGVGAAGPMTDNLAPPGQIGRAAPGARPEAAPFLGGFCFLLKRPAAEAVGALDERFVWGWEDIDYCLRLRHAGYSLALARGVFVHHAGSRTLRRMPSPRRRDTDLANRALLAAKWIGGEPWRGDLLGLLDRCRAPWRAPAPRHSVLVIGRDAAAALRRLRETPAGAGYEAVTASLGASPRARRAHERALSGWRGARLLGHWRGVTYSHAVNLAAAEARGESLVVLDEEARVAPGWLAALAGAARRRPDAGVVAPDGDARRLRDGRPAFARQGCLLIPRAAFAALGGFDDRFAASLGAEDYCLRARQRGFHVVTAPGALIARPPDGLDWEPAGDRRLLFDKWLGHPLFPVEAK